MAQKPLELNATITAWETLAPGLAIFTVVKDAPFETFVPGQYTVLGLNYADTSISRAYSIGSAPEKESHGLDFYVRRVGEPKGDVAFTHLLFDRKVGDRIWVGPKPRGHFTAEHALHGNEGKSLVFVAAGTGLAPFVSMVVSHAMRHGSASPQHYIMHGSSHAHDLGYRAELERLLGNRYLATISRPTPEWRGARGRVESHFEPERIGDLERSLGMPPGFISPANCVVLVCGLQGTIANCLTHLFHRGFVPEERKLRSALGIAPEATPTIFFEQYDSEPILDVKDEALMATMRGRLARAGVPIAAPAAG